MINFIFSADYMEPSLSNGYGIDLPFDELSLSPKKLREILAWNEKYDRISLLGEQGVKYKREAISALDKQGVAFLPFIFEHLPENSFVTYSSSGLLTLLHESRYPKNP